jgi:hypothetical protein
MFMEESMSLFNKVLEEHEKRNSEVIEAQVQEAAEVTVALQTFSSDFHAAVSSVARPLFEEFASDALRHGFPLGIEEGVDGNGNPFISVRFIPERGTTFGTNRSIECTFVLKGLLAEQKVEHASYFDQRPGKDGVTKDEFEIQAINQNVLESLLTKFFRASLSTKDRV